MEVERYEPGIPCWVDLGTSDIAKGAEFYSALFGWDIELGGEEIGGYPSAPPRGEPVGGPGRHMNPRPPHRTPYTTVETAAATAAQVKENGGHAVMGPQQLVG